MTKQKIPVPDFTLAPAGPISKGFLGKGLSTFAEAVQWMHQLPYGRNSDRAAYEQVLEEERGTCSTKHAALAALAQEHNAEVSLVLIIGKLDVELHPGCKPLLQYIGCDYLPEAHCFLTSTFGDCDISFPDQGPQPRMQSLTRQILQPHEIGAHKQKVHRQYLSAWIQQEEGPNHLSLEELWALRTQWIEQLTALEGR